MSGLIGGIFGRPDLIQMESLDQRLVKSEVISANIANSETPGFRALGYGFEKQLQGLQEAEGAKKLKTSNGKHLHSQFLRADGKMYPDVFVRPTESIPEDGNTVDIDMEMKESAENQILYRATVELLNKKVGILRYAISAGGR